jgi:hypothetical protein
MYIYLYVGTHSYARVRVRVSLCACVRAMRNHEVLCLSQSLIVWSYFFFISCSLTRCYHFFFPFIISFLFIVVGFRTSRANDSYE